MFGKTIGKSLLIWMTIIPLAILNGGLRERVLAPLIGRLALPASGLLLCLLIFLVAYFLIPRLGKMNRKAYLGIGLAWLFMTLIFEFGFGFLNGKSLEDLLRAYDVSTGNLWPIVVVFTGAVPGLVARIRRL